MKTLDIITNINQLYFSCADSDSVWTEIKLIQTFMGVLATCKNWMIHSKTRNYVYETLCPQPFACP